MTILDEIAAYARERVAAAQGEHLVLHSFEKVQVHIPVGELQHDFFGHGVTVCRVVFK